MFKRILKIIGAVIAATIILSIANDLLTYRVDRDAGVDFGKYHEYSGVINIHTRFSNGSGTYRQIGEMCDSLGIHFAIISDRNSVQPMKDSLARRFGMSLIVPAVEISADGENGHFLLIGDSIPHLPRSGITSDSVLHGALKQGSMVMLENAIHSFNGPDRDNSDAGEFTGIELYNFDEGLRSSLNFFGINKMIAACIVYGFQGEALNYLLEYPGKEMRAFDDMNMSRKVVGIGSLGAYSNIKLRKNSYWHFPSYQSLFDLVHTVIVTREQFNGLYHHDRELLLNSIRKGNMFVSFCGLENARGFLFTATADTNEVVMGDSLKAERSAILHIVMPDSDGVETQIVWNGQVIASYENAGSIDLPVLHPGEYRVQAFQKRVMLPLFMKRSYPWILSNPIHIYR
ncbi:MAG: hypothetical protein ACLP05_13480 [Candidatus Kryptoniota bacterium]